MDYACVRMALAHPYAVILIVGIRVLLLVCLPGKKQNAKRDTDLKLCDIP